MRNIYQRDPGTADSFWTDPFSRPPGQTMPVYNERGELIGWKLAPTNDRFSAGGGSAGGGGGTASLGPSTPENMAATAAAGAPPAALAATGAGTAALMGTPLGKLLTALFGLGTGFATRGLAGNAANANVPPQLSQLLDLSVQRAQSQQPLFNAMTNGLYQMLPNFARNDASASGSPTAPGATSGGAPMPAMPSLPAASMGTQPLPRALLPSAPTDYSGPIDSIKQIFGNGQGT